MPVEKSEWVFIAGLTLLAALLRFPFLSRFGLWLDELYVRDNALEPLGENLQTVHFVHFAAVKAGLALADNPFGLRLASASFGIAAVPLAWFAVRRALAPFAALLFSFFLAVTPYFINYSIDANYYSHVIFWSLAGLATAFRCYERPRLWLLLPLAGFGLLAFFVHPFSAPFFATTAAVMIVSVGAAGRSGVQDDDAKPGSERLRTKYAGYGIGLLLLFVLIQVLSGTAAGRELIRVAGRFIAMIEPGESPTNIEFSLAFFENYFRRIGPAYYAINEEMGGGLPLMPMATAGLFLVFCAGLWVMRRKPEQVATVLLPFLLCFGVIFNLDAERHFNIRYFSALVPLYWLSVSAALAWVVQHLIEIRAPEGPSGRRRAIQALPFAAMTILFLPQHIRLMTTDGRNWDEVMPFVAEHVRPDEPIVYTNWAEEKMLPHYQKLYGLEGTELIRLPHTGMRSALTASALRDLCYRTPGLWFVSSWLAIQSPEAVDWAEFAMDRAARGRSIFSNQYNVTAYHWNWGGRYILAPRILDYEPGKQDFDPEGFSQKFWVETALPYRIEVVPIGTDRTGEPTLHVDGHAVSWMPAAPELPRGVWSADVEMGAGERTVRVGGVIPGDIATVRFTPVYPEGEIPIRATDAAAFYPSEYVWSEEREGEGWVGLKRNTFASWEFGVATSGAYEWVTEAVHDRPPPVWIELRLDDDSVGVIQFEQGNNRPGIRRFPVHLAEGNHILTARFLNEGNVQTADESVDRDAWIRGFLLRPADSAGADERVFSPHRGWVRVGMGRPGNAELAEGWTAVTDGDLNPELIAAEIPGRVAWKATLPRDSKGLLLKGPIVPVPSDPMVYLSGLIRTRELLNHSANMKVYYFDREGNPIGESVVNQEGIYRTTDWIRFVEFQPLPEQVGYYQAMFWVYPNGSRPSSLPGSVYFGDLRIETGDPGAESKSGN